MSAADHLNYEVFLSFRGPDSRQGLADVLYNYMKDAGIRVFRDNDELATGDKINKILTALENSEICVPIFSENFAASAWCLREVEAMVDQRKKIMPVFHTASPDDIKLKKGKFKEDLRKHEEKHEKEQVNKWEEALKAVGEIKGQEVNNTGFAQFSKSFVRELLSKLKVKTKYVTNYLVERKSQEDGVMNLLDVGANDVRLVGIHGMGGAGKTTLAKVVFNKISTRFDCQSFFENIQESTRLNGLDHLLRKLLEDLGQKWKFDDRRDNVTILREDFQKKKVLIVLDDVNRRKEIEDIVRALTCFGSESRIIVTTRDRRIFTENTRAFEMDTMNGDQALQLFSRHAFEEESPPSDYQALTDEVLSLTGRLPLALEVIGSFLHRKEKKRWETTIKKLRIVPNENITSKLRLSYDALQPEQKQIFLDIACFFIGREKFSAIYMWEACDFFPDDGIEVLESMSLVKITSDKRFWMHDLIRDLGRELVREEYIDDPAKRSRIWSHKDALEVLKIKEGKENVKGLLLEKFEKISLTSAEFSSFKNLKLLGLVGTKWTGDFYGLLPKLKWFSWRQCRDYSTMANLSLESLVVLDLYRSSISEAWAGWSILKRAKNLKVLDLTGCHKLKCTPDLSSNEALERLILRECYALTDIHCSVGMLKRLEHLDLTRSSISETSAGWGMVIQRAKNLKVLDLTECCNLTCTPDLSSNEVLERLILRNCRALAEIHCSIGMLKRLKHLDIFGCDSLQGLPEELGSLKDLELYSLEREGGDFRLPESIGNIKSLSVIKLDKIRITRIPNSVGRLMNLTRLILRDCFVIEKLPDAIGDLGPLLELDLSFTGVSVLPQSVGNLAKLRKLLLNGTKISEIPNTIGDLTSLLELYVSMTNVSVLPHSIGHLSKLQRLRLGATNIREIPDTIGYLRSLLELDVSKTSISELPRSVGHLVKLQKLYLYETEISEIPDTIGGLTSLLVLDVSKTSISVLPHSIGHLSKLQLLILWSTNIEELPDSLKELTLLRRLSLNGTKLRILPEFVGDFKELKYLDMRNCQIRKLPTSIENLTNLQYLSIHASSLSTEIPVQVIENLPASSTSHLKASCSARHSSLQKQVSYSGSLGIEENVMGSDVVTFDPNSTTTITINLEAFTALSNLNLDCTGAKHIGRLPSTLKILTLSDVTENTRLPDFSNLKKLEIISFSDCSVKDVDELKSLGEIKTLKSMWLSNCNWEMVDVSLQLQNVRSLNIFYDKPFRTTLLDFRGSISLETLDLQELDVVVEIRGLEKLVSLTKLHIWRCDSLVKVGNLSELRSLASVDIRDCPKLREVEGLDGLYLESTTIERCGSMIITDELKKRCREGRFDGIDVENLDVSGNNDVIRVEYS